MLRLRLRTRLTGPPVGRISHRRWQNLRAPYRAPSDAKLLLGCGENVKPPRSSTNTRAVPSLRPNFLQIKCQGQPHHLQLAAHRKYAAHHHRPHPAAIVRPAAILPTLPAHRQKAVALAAAPRHPTPRQRLAARPSRRRKPRKFGSGCRRRTSSTSSTMPAAARACRTATSS